MEQFDGTTVHENRIEERLNIYKHIAESHIASYNKNRASQIKNGVLGEAGENILRDWMKEWLPQRVSIKDGTVISAKDDPTEQMDCLLFDHIDSPFFTPSIFPIEGVLGAIEINTGENTTYSKIIHDANKLSLLNKLARSEQPRRGRVWSHLPADREATAEENIDLNNLVLHRQVFSEKKISIIFAENISGSLEEASHRIAEHNIKQGVRNSIDGLFVLQKGFALHVDPDIQGWSTTRLKGSLFACLKTEPGQVLFKLQSIILKNLKTNPDFDVYATSPSQAKKELNMATQTCDESYKEQADDALILRV